MVERVAEKGFKVTWKSMWGFTGSETRLFSLKTVGVKEHSDF